ncbi:MAG: DUF3581 domain-containing protein [Sulfuriflexus sp.]|nr:DUF3581 domain-containing protein [Sulfuriflexus sp.]
MFLDKFHTQQGQTIQVSREQASDFAKSIAGDFNPIHDVDAKRFCVPGDLLFSLVLNKYGVSQHMHFTFSGMVGDGVELIFPEMTDDEIVIKDVADKSYLSIAHSGDNNANPDVSDNLSRRYVEFSGQTFPHILVPLMAKHNVMINPARPLVIYESMTINIDELDISNPELTLTESKLDIQGKRGNVTLKFAVSDNGKIVGSGEKTMVMSGLREFEQGAIDQLVNDYAASKQSY